MVLRNFPLAEPEEARSIVVEDVAFLLLVQKGGLLNQAMERSITPGHTMWSDPNITRLPNPASTIPRRYR